MSEDGLTKTAKRVEAIRKILTNSIWILILVIVLAAIGRHIVANKYAFKPGQERRPTVKPIEPAVAWDEVDKAVAAAIAEARKNSKAFASRQIDLWIADLMDRVDSDFLDWYFSYWTQQVLGLEGLYQYGVNHFLTNQPTAAEKLTEEIQEEFSKRVLRPQIAELEFERIVRNTANFYVGQLRTKLDSVPTRYKIPQVDWERYMEGIAITTKGTDGNRETPLTLKALTATTAGGAVFIAGQMNVLIGKLTGKVMAKYAGKAASKVAAKTGGKVAAKVGGKFLGVIVGVGVLVWDIWDHIKTSRENRPILRQAIVDYFKELKDILMNDPEAGIMITFDDFEKQILSSLRQNQPLAQLH